MTTVVSALTFGLLSAPAVQAAPAPASPVSIAGLLQQAPAAGMPPAAVGVPSETPTPAAGAGLTVTRLSVEHLENPAGVGSKQPRLSWQLASGEREKSQTAYQIQVASAAESLLAEAPDVWDTGQQAGDAQNLVPYGGPALTSATPYFWRVRVWDEDGTPSPWSEVAQWTTALLEQSDWKASWISPASTAPGGSYLRKSFTLPQDPVRATAFVSGRGVFERPVDNQGFCCLQSSTLARGIYELSANGAKVGDAELEAQPTDSRVRSLYRTWDVTSMLHAGENAVGFLLGEDSDVILQINIEWPSGPPTVITTDGTWTSRPGPVTRAHKFHGETFDARKQIKGWDTAAGGGSGWSQVRTNSTLGVLDPSPNEPMRVVNNLSPVKINQPAPGVYVADFGKNISGSVELSMVIPAGRTVSIRHGERLLNGRVNNSVTQAMQTSTFIGDGTTSRFAARFGYAGYRWAEISGLDAPPPAGSFTAREIRNDVATTGSFKASVPLMNSLHEANRQTQVNGLHGIPEDTPTREKRGWMADAHLAAEASINNYGMAAFYTKFVQDMEDAQKPSGFVPDIVPVEQGTFWNEQSDPAWAAATVLIPYYAWKSYGDDNIIAGHYDSMDRWMGYLRTVSDGYLITRPSMTWGQDWVGAESTNSGLFQTGFYYLTAKLMAEMAEKLGKSADVAKYTTLSKNIAEAFNKRYFDAGKASYGNSQFSNAMPLTLGIVPAGRAHDVTQTLVHQVMVVGGGHILGGLPGAKYVVDALELMGRSDIVNIMVNRTDSPGWAYMLTHGPGSIWEEWYGSPSLNHPMFTFVDNWLYTAVAGISQTKEAGGYREILFDPQITSKLPAAGGSVQTPFGDARIQWNTDGRKTSYAVTVPVGATGKLTLRKTKPEAVAESGQLPQGREGIRSVTAAGDDTVVVLGSGSFNFVSDPALAELVAASSTTAAIGFEVAAISPAAAGFAVLQKPADDVETEVTGALSAFLQRDGDATSELRSAVGAARAFTQAVGDARALGLPGPTADSLTLKTASAINSLSGAVEAAGVTATAAAVEQHTAAGGSTDVVVTVNNKSDTAVSQLNAGLELPAGWSSRLVSRFPASIEPGSEARATFSVTAPGGSSERSYPATSRITFTQGSDSVTRNAAFDLNVGPDLTADEAALRPRILEPGGTGFTVVRLRNLQTSADRPVRVAAARLPEGWRGSDAVDAVVPAGGEVTALVPVHSAATAASGTIDLAVTDHNGTVLATAQAPALVRGSANCAVDTTGETCLAQSTRLLSNFEDGTTGGWTSGPDSNLSPGAAGDGGSEAFLGAGALKVTAAPAAGAPAWREASLALAAPVDTGDASALVAALRLAEPVPGAAYEARIRAGDGNGHTSEAIHRIAPGSWNRLVLPTAEAGLRQIASVSVAVRSTTSGVDTAGFSLDAVALDYSQGGENLAASAAVTAEGATETGGWSAQSLVDAMAFSTAESRGFRGTGSASESLQLDLKSVLPVGSVVLHPVTVPAGEEPFPAGTGMPTSAGVEVSTDGVTWQRAAVTADSAAEAGAPLRLTLAPVEARYVRITAAASPAGAALQLSEVEVFGPGNAAAGHPGDAAVDQGDSASFEALPPGQPGATLQWQRSTDGGSTFGDIDGANGTTLILPVLRKDDDGGQVRAVVKAADGSELGVSPPASISVRSEALSITAQPQDQYLVLEDPAGARLDAGAAGSGKRLQWQSSVDGGTSWRNVTGASDSSLTVAFSQGSAVPTEQFRLVATNLLGQRVASNPATVRVAEAPTVTAPELNVAALPGKDIELKVQATGAPEPALAWFRQETPTSGWTEITGAASTALNIGAADVRNGSRYRAVAKNAFGEATGAEITVSILTPAEPAPEAESPVGDKPAAAGEATIAHTGASLAPLLIASSLLLAGSILLALHRGAIRRRARSPRTIND